MRLQEANAQWAAVQTSDEAYEFLGPLVDEVDARQAEIEKLGVVDAPMVEVPVPGPHRLLVQNETVQPSGAFKDNGAANALLHAIEEQPELTTVQVFSAGNWAGAVALAGAKAGVQTVAHVPATIAPAKESLLQEYGAAIVKHDSLEQARVAAQKDADQPRSVFLHAFNNPYGIAGQSAVARRMLRNATEMGVDLAKDRIVMNVQAGGGSLVLGAMVRVMDAWEAGTINENFELRLCQPVDCDAVYQFSQGNTTPYATRSMDKRFDGLAVYEPSPQAALMSADPEYAQGMTHVTEADCGRAAGYLYGALGTRIEPAGLVSTAAYFAKARAYTEPTTFIAVASGRNVTPGTYHDFTVGALQREQQAKLAAIPRIEYELDELPQRGTHGLRVADGHTLR